MTVGRLAGKTAVITGGASGIGFETARRFLEEGANVLIGDYNESAAATAVSTLKAEGFDGRIDSRRADVSQETDVENLLQSAVSIFGKLDIVFNNAGIGGAIGPIEEVDVEHWNETFAVMTRGVFLGIKHAARIMKTTGGGSIINTASIAGLAAGVIPLAYSAAKTATVSLTQNAAAELAEYRIRVNAICPGVIFTPLMHGGREDVADKAAKIVQPWPDRGEPRHVANFVLFLASDESEFVTGGAHVVDGGYLANGLLRVHPLHGDTEKARQFAGMTFGMTGKPKLE